MKARILIVEDERAIRLALSGLLRREGYEIEKFEQRAATLQGPEFQAAWRVAFMAPLLTGMGQLAIILAMWAGGNNVLNNEGLSVGDVSTFTQYMALIITPLALLAQVMPLVLRGDVSAKRIIELMETEATITEPEHPIELTDAGWHALPNTGSEHGRLSPHHLRRGIQWLPGPALGTKPHPLGRGEAAAPTLI